mgnify:CR=1 FL=1
MSQNHKISNNRYERKFFISDMSTSEVESTIKIHPSIFSSIFHSRFINNIYFDSYDLSSYYDNVEGSERRVKVRLRWYGELFGKIEKPTLEFKIKNGILGKKISCKLPSFEFKRGFDLDMLRPIILKSKISDICKIELNDKIPTLVNRYSRKYFISDDNRFRITLDNNQSFYQVGPKNNYFLKKVDDKSNTILEIKYSINDDDKANRISNFFPFRLSKSSKYVTGIEKVYKN